MNTSGSLIHYGTVIDYLVFQGKLKMPSVQS